MRLIARIIDYLNKIIKSPDYCVALNTVNTFIWFWNIHCVGNNIIEAPYFSFAQT